jgi:hypothetical protein
MPRISHLRRFMATGLLLWIQPHLPVTSESALETQIWPNPKEDDNVERLHYTEAQADLKAMQEEKIAPYLIDLNYYEYKVIDDLKNPEYTISVIIDPCRTRDPGCCQDQFGSPVSCGG